MRLRLTGPGRSADVQVAVPDGSTPLAALLRTAGVDPLPDQVTVDGRAVYPHVSIGALALHDGSTIGLAPPDRSARPLDPLNTHTPAARLVQVAGGRSGAIISLPVGCHDLGPAGRSGGVQTPVVRIEVGSADTVQIATVGSGTLRLDGLSLTGPVLEPIRAGLHLATADALFRIGPGPTAHASRSPVHPVGLSGRLRYERTPRSAPPAAPPPPLPPKWPTLGSPAPQLSLAMVLAPIPVAVAMALLLSPHFLIFAAFTPLLALGRWVEGVWRQRRAERVLVKDRAEALGSYETVLASYAAEQSARVRAASPDLTALLDTARVGGPGLWSRRPGTMGYLQLPVGYGDRPGPWEVPTGVDPAVQALAARWRRLPDVPLGLDLDHHLGVGLVGPGAAELAATALVHAAAAHGPAQLQLAVVCDAERIRHWDWLKWLPHADGTPGRPAVAMTAAEVGALFAATPGQVPDLRRPGAASGPVRVVVVDSAALLEAVLNRLAAAPDRECTRLCVVAPALDRLPAVCTQVVVRDGARLTVTDLAAAVTVRGVLPACADAATVTELARALSRYLDPEVESSGASLPRTVDLAQVLGGGLGSEALRTRWDQAGPELLATLGTTDDGPLVVDLIADGPHMLVAGTTGSGKSELLRTFVASLACRYGPDRLNLVLVDFKGGGAFDACVDLPHTVGVVTDLDEQLAARALRCLRAEVRHRERVLRAAGVSDLADLPGAELPGADLPGADGVGANRVGPPAPARLLLVIDEFATLAAELPDFMGSLVDIAQRGRSLGLHLVLATQRPSGVVDSKIRANTNLRLALRVQSDADSVDVLNASVAARIDRRTPGRGYALLGAGELRAFQTALVSTHTPIAGPPSVRVEPFTLAALGPSASRPPAPPAGPTSAITDLQRIVEASQRAAAEMAPARVPWPAPLPDQVEAETLWAGQGPDGDPDGDRVHLGLVDRPDQQRVDLFRWSCRRGPLLAYGADPSATTGVVVTAAADLARRLSADALHLYLFDFSPGSGIERLAALPHVAVRVGPADHELLLRAVDTVERELDRRRDAVRAGGLSAPQANGAAPVDPAAPLIMVGIAGYQHLLAVAEELGRLDLPGRLERLIAEGSPLGVVSVLTTHHERGVPGRLASQISTRIAFRLADAAAYTSFGLRPRAVPDLRGHRAVDLESGDEVTIATPTTIRSAGVGQGGPRRVQTLAVRVPAGALSGHSRRDGTVWQLAVGTRHSDLGPAVVTLHPGNHLVVTGGPASGRTSTLRTLAESLSASGPADLRVLSSRPEEWAAAEWAGAEWAGVQILVGPDAVRTPVRQPTLVVVDGLDSAAAYDLALTGLTDDPQVRIAVADRVDAFRLPATWLRRVLAGRVGILLQPQPDHGDLLRVRLPMRNPVAHPAGRGYLVENGFAELVQVALPADDPTGTDRVTTTSVTA